MRFGSILILMVLSSLALSLPSISLVTDPVYSGNGRQIYGGQMAVATVTWNPPGLLPEDEYNTIALTQGTSVLKILIFDPNTYPYIIPIDSVDVDGTPSDECLAWDPSIMLMQIDTGFGRHPCIVIPTLSPGPEVNSICIYDLETRTPYRNLLPTHADIVQVFKISEEQNPLNDVYGISSNGDEASSQVRIAQLLGQGSSLYFNVMTNFEPDQMHYACISWPDAPARIAESFLIESTGLLGDFVITTCHNISATIWNASNYRELSQIGVAQPGGSLIGQTYGSPLPQVDHELGDTHRAAVITASNGVPALLFLPIHTMGMQVYDIYSPDEPKFVWQWDSDTQMFSSGTPPTDTTPFAWTGSGEYNDGPTGYTNSHPPGNTFGIGSYSNASTGDIHIFLADGVDGLLAFDFSHFFCPFGTIDDDRMLDYFNIYYRYTDPLNSYINRIAYDVRTLELAEGFFILTSWRDNISNGNGDFYDFHISVHEDNIGLNTPQSSSAYTEISQATASAPLAALHSANPASESISISLCSAGGDMTVAVFDICGRKVFDETVPEQATNFEWNCSYESGSQVAPGRYFVMVSDRGGQTASIPVMVVADPD